MRRPACNAHVDAPSLVADLVVFGVALAAALLLVGWSRVGASAALSSDQAKPVQISGIIG